MSKDETIGPDVSTEVDVEVGAEEQDGIETSSEQSTTRRRTSIILGVVVLGIVFIGVNVNVLGAKFGYSHDGFNAAVWSIGARSMERDGVISSKFGGDNARGSYANHPPVIYSEVALARTLPVDDHLAARLPAVISSIIALGVMAAVLCELGLSTATILGALALMTSSAMFIVFGPMIDTPVLALPICAATVLIFARTRNDRTTPRWVVVGVPFIAALTSWTSVTFALLTIIAFLLLPDRRRTIRAMVIPMTAGLVTGLLLTSSWIWWVYGSFGRLLDNGSIRAGGGVTLTQSLHEQWVYLWDAMPILCTVGGIGVVLALTKARSRGVVALSILPVVIYAVVFRHGAFVHQYWNFALLIGVTIGVGELLDPLIRRTEHSFIPHTTLIGAICIIAIGSLFLPSSAQQQRSAGIRVAKMFDTIGATGPSASPTGSNSPLGLVGPTIEGAPWAFYETDGETVDLELTPDSLRRASDTDPAQLVMLSNFLLWSYGAVDAEVPIVTSAGGLSVVRVSDLEQLVRDADA